MKYFTYRETGTDPLRRLLIVPTDYDLFPFNTKKGGSYNVAPARVLGLSYPEYLRYLRQAFPDIVTIEGKDCYYVVPYWKKGKELFTFIDLLNAKLTLAVQSILDNIPAR